MAGCWRATSGRHIPGNPSIVAKNMPGAGGVALANHLYNRAPKDGTEFATVQNGLPFEKLFHMLSPGGKAALFDSTKFGWLGSMTQTVFVTVTWHASPTKTLQDAMARETILGASGTSADSYVLAMLSNNLLGTKFKVVHRLCRRDPGVARGRERRGRGRGRQGLDHAHLDQAAVDQGQADQHHRADGHAAACRHHGRADGDRARARRLTTAASWRLCSPSSTCRGRSWRRRTCRPSGSTLLRRAFDATLKDPAVLAEAAKLGMEIKPVRGSDVEALVTRMMNTPDALAERARDVLKPPKQ